RRPDQPAGAVDDAERAHRRLLGDEVPYADLAEEVGGAGEERRGALVAVAARRGDDGHGMPAPVAFERRSEAGRPGGDDDDVLAALVVHGVSLALPRGISRASARAASPRNGT